MSEVDADELATKIYENAPHFVSGRRKFFIVERDLQIEESELLKYAQGLVESPAASGQVNPLELIGATFEGKLMRWKPGTKLTWAVDRQSFPEAKTAEKAAEICHSATADWNTVAQEAEAPVEFLETKDGDSPVFRFSYEVFSNPGIMALAFFPNDPEWKRVVRIGPATFVEPSIYDPVGVLRHELGHVLGFRHEHIRPEAPMRIEDWTTQTLGAEALGSYDPKSVMHYPMGEAGTLDFKITALDLEGFRNLYQLSADRVKDYEP